MVQQPLILVVGGDKLALRVTEELCATAGHRVALMWHHDPEIAAYAEKLGAEFLGFPPNDFDSLHAAGVDEAASIMALSDDDRLNLQVALKARDINPKIRVVLRQFNRQLGPKDRAESSRLLGRFALRPCGSDVRGLRRRSFGLLRGAISRSRRSAGGFCTQARIGVR